jgi:hypothetical protein
MVDDQHRDAAPAQPQQPLLQRQPGVAVVLAQPSGQARQVVDDDQLDAVEPALDLGLHPRLGEIADLALQEIGRQDVEEGEIAARRAGPRVGGGRPGEPLLEVLPRHLAVDQQHAARSLGPPLEKA